MRTLVLSVSLLSVSVAIGQTPKPPDPTKEKKESKPKGYPDKLIHAPTPMPDRVILTWSGNTATTQSVTWRTDTTVTTAVGQITEATDGPSFDAGWGGKKVSDVVRSVPAITEPLKTDLNASHRHSVTFRGLKPKTKYAYRVGAGADWSEWFQFETTADKPEPFGFIYVGDAQNDVRRHWSRLIRQAVADMPDAKFLLHAGDLINRGYSDADWGEWYQAMGWVTGGYRHVVTPGNHEYGSAPKGLILAPKAVDGEVPPKAAKKKAGVTSYWRPQFTLPDHGPKGLEETCYYLDIQGVRFVVLNSMERLEDQVPWLENVLKTNPHKWVIVTFHVPAYSTAANRQKNEENKAVRKLWRPILDRYGVDLVLQGHDHSYGRSGLMRNDTVLPNGEEYDKKGSVYVVSVSGPKMYPVGQQPWMMSYAEKKQLYQLIRIDGDRLRFEARTANGNLFDEFELRKKLDGRSELLERSAIEAEKAGSGSPVGREALFALGGIVLLAGGYAAVRSARRNGSGAHGSVA